MIKPIRNLNRILISKPRNAFPRELLQRLLIKSIPNHNGNVRANLTLQIDDGRKTKCQNDLEDEELAIVVVPVVHLVLGEVADGYVDEDVQQLGAQDYYY